MKTISTLLILLAVAMSFTACDKNCDDDNDGDLTTSIVGLYLNTSTNTDVTVNKIDDTHVSIQIATENGSSRYTVAFTNVVMNSETAFTLNSVTGDDSCNDQTYSGTGTHTGDNISLFITITGACGGTESVSATRQ